MTIFVIFPSNSIADIQSPQDHRDIANLKCNIKPYVCFQSCLFKSNLTCEKTLIYALLNISFFQNNNVPASESLSQEILFSH